MVREFRMSGNEPQGSSGKSPLFDVIHGQCCRCQGPATPTAHFDEDQYAIVKHDQVELAMSAVEVTRYQGQSAADEPVLGQLFGGST